MPELPEITLLARAMQRELPGRTIAEVEPLQAQCLNLPVDEFSAALRGATFREVTSHGKWIQARADRGWLLISLGMGGEVLLTDREHLPEKRRLILDLAPDPRGRAGSALAINFWWFGYAHFATDPAAHPMVSRLGPDALGLSLDEFRELLAGRRGGIKSFLLNQSRIAGIGNVYVQSPLWRARIHPLRPIPSLTDDEIATLWRELQATLQASLAVGGAHFELGLYGEPGGYHDAFLEGFVDGAPCPVCGTPLAAIRTGSTPGYVCPGCQDEGR